MNATIRDRFCHLNRSAGLALLITIMTAAPGIGAERSGPSALFGRLVRAMSRPVPPAATPGLELPASTSWQALHWSIGLAVSMDGLWVEGKRIVELEQGQLPEDALDEHRRRIDVLFNLLKKVREIEESGQVEGAAEQTAITLQADRRLPYLTVWQVLASAAMAGYSDFHVVVQNGPGDLPSPMRVASIPISLPVAAPTHSGALIGKVSLGSRKPDAERGLVAMVLILDDQVQVTASGPQDPEDLKAYSKTIQGTWPERLQALTAWTAEIHSAAPGSDTVVIVPHNSIPWQRVVDSLDATREQVPDQHTGQRLPLLNNAVLTRVIE